VSVQESRGEPALALEGRGWGVLLATVIGSGMAFLDGTVVNVALPALGRSLHAGLSGLQWTLDGYLLTLCALLLLGGELGDRFGRRRVYLMGMGLFALASAACGLAPSVEWLVAARLAQGVGGALLVPASLAIVRAVFREADQGRAIGLWSGLSGVTTAVGPLLGGWLIDALSWRWVFLLNLPLALLGAFLTLRCMPETRDPDAAPRLDVLGALLATLGLGGVTYGLIEGASPGAQGTLAFTLLGALALVAFLGVEARKRAPMLPLSLFRSRQFSGANGTTLALYFALNGALFLVVLALQTALGYSALEAGAALAPITAVLLVLSPVAGKATGRFGHRVFMTVGPLLAAAGLLLLTRLGLGTGYVRGVLPGVLVLALGLGLTVAPLTTAVFQSVRTGQAGIASGVNNAVARVAGLLAVALLPGAAGIVDWSGRDPAALLAGLHRALWICAVGCALGAAVAFFTVDREGRPS
jgi:EmrB/QacA subfamily drug resistance transporter